MKALGLNRRTVYRWLAAFQEGGQNALLAKPISGRPSSLSEEERVRLSRSLAEHMPQQYRFEFGRWTVALICALIAHHLGKTLSVNRPGFCGGSNL